MPRKCKRDEDMDPKLCKASVTQALPNTLPVRSSQPLAWLLLSVVLCVILKPDLKLLLACTFLVYTALACLFKNHSVNQRDNLKGCTPRNRLVQRLCSQSEKRFFGFLSNLSI